MPDSPTRVLLALLVLLLGGTARAGDPPFEVSLAPATLTQAQSSAIDVTCTVSNTSGKPITLLWDVPRVKLAKGSVHVFTAGWGGKEQKRLELAPGESRRLSVSVATGETIPVLDVGVYQVVVEVTIAEEVPGRHATGTARLRATEKREGEPLTAAAVVAIARAYCERTNSQKPQRINYDSYFIRRHGSDWDVEFAAGSGSVTVSVNPTDKKAFVRAVP